MAVASLEVLALKGFVSSGSALHGWMMQTVAGHRVCINDFLFEEGEGFLLFIVVEILQKWGDLEIADKKSDSVR